MRARVLAHDTFVDADHAGDTESRVSIGIEL